MDIGMAPRSALSPGARDVNLEYDNEGYMNTGAQSDTHADGT